MVCISMGAKLGFLGDSSSCVVKVPDVVTGDIFDLAAFVADLVDNVVGVKVIDSSASGAAVPVIVNAHSLVRPHAQIVDVGWLSFCSASASRSCGSWRTVISVLAFTCVSDTIYKWMAFFSTVCRISAFGRHDRRTKRASLPNVRVSTHTSVIGADGDDVGVGLMPLSLGGRR